MGIGKNIVGKIGFPQLNVLVFVYVFVLEPTIHLKKVKFIESFMDFMVSVSQRDVVKINERIDQRIDRFFWSLFLRRNLRIRLRTVVRIGLQASMHR